MNYKFLFLLKLSIYTLKMILFNLISTIYIINLYYIYEIKNRVIIRIMLVVLNYFHHGNNMGINFFLIFCYFSYDIILILLLEFQTHFYTLLYN